MLSMTIVGSGPRACPQGNRIGLPCAFVQFELNPGKAEVAGISIYAACVEKVVVRRSFVAWALVTVCVVGCVPDNTRTAQIPAGRHEDSTRSVEQLKLEDVPALESFDPWDNEYGPGLRLTTAHYEIFTTLLKPMMLRVIPGFMESVYGAYNSQLPQVREAPDNHKVYLFANRRQWEKFTRDFAGEQAETFCRIKEGAYYHRQVCVAYDIGRVRTLSVLGHEGWHQFSDTHFKFRLPSWLDEGVATLFETCDAESGTFQLEPAGNAYRLNALARTLAEGRMIQLRELITSNPGDAFATDRTETVMAFYSQSYALVRFLRESDSGRHLGDYRRLLADGLRGDWPLDNVSRRIAADRSVPRNILWNHVVGLVLFEDYVGNDYEKIESEYLAFCGQIVECGIEN